MIKKLTSIESMKKIIFRLKANKKKIVLCHGVFDLLHIGHIKHFNEAKNLGDILVVSLTPDKYVNKGPGRPAFNEKLSPEDEELQKTFRSLYASNIKRYDSQKETKNSRIVHDQIRSSFSTKFLRENKNWLR